MQTGSRRRRSPSSHTRSSRTSEFYSAPARFCSAASAFCALDERRTPPPDASTRSRSRSASSYSARSYCSGGFYTRCLNGRAARPSELMNKIAKIVKSNSHVDYVARVVDELDADSPPSREDYGFAQFVSVPVAEGEDVVGVVYDTQLVNPEYGSFGPRLSSHADLKILSPDFLHEQGVLLGVLLVGWRGRGGVGDGAKADVKSADGAKAVGGNGVGASWVNHQ